MIIWGNAINRFKKLTRIKDFVKLQKKVAKINWVIGRF